MDSGFLRSDTVCLGVVKFAKVEVSLQRFAAWCLDR